MEYIDLLSSPESGQEEESFSSPSPKTISDDKQNAKKSKEKKQFGKGDFAVSSFKNKVNENNSTAMFHEEKKKGKRKIGPIRYNGRLFCSFCEITTKCLTF